MAVFSPVTKIYVRLGMHVSKNAEGIGFWDSVIEFVLLPSLVTVL
jgi:hypothetical protein